MSEQQQLMRDIQIVSFMLKDAELFLDTHPDDAQALSFFNYYNQLLAALTRDYEAKFGPLTTNSSISAANATRWSWTDEPWPWEKED